MGEARLLVHMTEDDLRAVVRDEMERAAHANQAEQLTVDEAANYMKRSTKTIRRYLAVGRLRGVRIAGGQILVERASIDRLLERPIAV
jgi:excisionase family DNA binding protein